MRRFYTQLVAALLTALAAVLTAGNAAASNSQCLGVLGNQYIRFNGSRLYVTDGKAPADKSWETETEEAKIREAKSTFILDALAASKRQGSIQFARDRRWIRARWRSRGPMTTNRRRKSSSPNDRRSKYRTAACGSAAAPRSQTHIGGSIATGVTANRRAKLP
jgi:hypothetical protein